MIIVEKHNNMTTIAVILICELPIIMNGENPATMLFIIISAVRSSDVWIF